jgi:sec-independent protein translocase protein TatA
MFGQFAILDLGTPQLLIILAIVLLLFGGSRLPQLSRGLGEAMRELRKGLNDDVQENKTEKTNAKASKKSKKA